MGCHIKFDKATQGFAVTQITSVGAADSGASCDPVWGSGDYTLERNGLDRAFRLHVPDAVGGMAPHPMVVFFHGWGGDEGEFLKPSVINEANERGYIIVAPLGLGGEEMGNHYSPGLSRVPPLGWTVRTVKGKFVTMH